MNDNNREETIRQLQQRLVVKPPKPITLEKQKQLSRGVVKYPRVKPSLSERG
jgi:hypothetical protein